MENDLFVLGNVNGVFYDDGDNRPVSDRNLALITEFKTSRDRMQLLGSADVYSLEFSTSETDKTNATLVYNPEGCSPRKIIAVLKNVDSNLSLENSAFTFV